MNNSGSTIALSEEVVLAAGQSLELTLE